MNLIEAYVHEVTRRLPEKIRNDIAMELRSSIEDTLPEKFTEEDVKNTLAKLGDPAVLAARYRDTPMYLIGPKVYDAYMWTMKRVIPWAILITILVHTVVGILSFTGEEGILSFVIRTFGIIIPNVINVLIQTFFWLTVVFVAIERIGLSKVALPLTRNGVTWTPDELKNVEIISKKKAVSKIDVVFSLIWTAIWAIAYFFSDHFIGVYKTLNGDGLQFVMPIFDRDTLLSYWPLIFVLILLEIGLAVYKLKASQWTIKLFYVNSSIRIFSTLTFIIIASNPTVINEAIIPYMSELLEISASSVANFITWLMMTVVVTIIVALIIEIFDSYRKAKVN